MWIPHLGEAYGRPLEYGDIIYYRQAPATPGVRADLFEQCFGGLVAGFGDVTAGDVRRMRPGIPRLLEYAIFVASDLLDESPERDERDESTFDDSAPADHDDSPFAQHQSGRGTDPLDDHDERDLVAQLLDCGVGYPDYYRLTRGEIDDILEGTQRLERRRNEARGESETTESGPTPGNKGDRASQMGWR
jgi:hypothetical protein